MFQQSKRGRGGGGGRCGNYSVLNRMRFSYTEQMFVILPQGLHLGLFVLCLL